MLPEIKELHTYNVLIAKKFGIMPAFIIHYIIEWMVYYSMQKLVNYKYNDRIWVPCTYEELHKYFYEFNEKTIRRTIKKLKDLKVIEIGNFNENKFNKTNWYTIIDENILNEYNMTKTGLTEISWK